MNGMFLLRKARRFRGQTATEYMITISVITAGLLFALDLFSKPDGPVQRASEQAASGWTNELSNDSGGTMRAQ